jgi:hypothetical protein
MKRLNIAGIFGALSTLFGNDLAHTPEIKAGYTGRISHARHSFTKGKRHRSQRSRANRRKKHA